ncbi:hypothetical protein [Desulfovibrio cuneatus]|uniref:hypothetical protein n=1 Tax=Desulfovibrio cuneatus TaxID=159728 RepID=UPI0004159904|nr:hypothetical protein [Desulfovibrio cuneatus]
MHDPKLGTITILVERARGTAHPPVLATLPLKPNQGILPSGLLLQQSASGLEPYAPGGTLAGVLDAEVDTTRQDSGLVIIHGSAQLGCLKVGAITQTPPDATTLNALLKLGVYPE